jgi:TatD DNase family protein
MDKIIKEIDLNRVMVETDAPYVSPKHIKGEINEPKNVFYVAEKIGSLKGIKSEEILKITHDNTRDFFQ